MTTQRLFIFLFTFFSVNGFSLTEDTLTLKISQASGIQKARLLNQLANKFKNYKPDTALILARQAEAIASNNNNDTTKSDAYGLMAECYNYLANFDSSAIYYMKAIKLVEKTKHRRRMASHYNGLGI